jgi:hypothetical protein
MQPHFATEVKARLYRAPMHHRIYRAPMHHRRDRLSSETQRLQAELVAINKSTSWRITEPLRRSGEFIWSIRRHRFSRLIF